MRLVTACHDLSDGGLGVALAEMCLGGRLGARIELDAVPVPEPMTPTELLYSESASRLLVSVRAGNEAEFEAALAGQICARIGVTTEDGFFRVLHSGTELLRESAENLARAFKTTLDW
jgi:phosphoribosylformylglycinamidine synthase